MKYVVLDTNVLLLDSSNLYTLSNGGEHTIVLPDTVIQELDSKKTIMEEIGYHARRTSGMLSDATLVKVDKQDARTVITLGYSAKSYDVCLELVANNNYKDDKNDLKIIEVAEDYMKEGKDVLFISNDTNCRFLALTKGITVDYVREQDDIKLNALVELIVEPEVFANLELAEALSINPGHVQENYAYHISSPTGNQALFLVRNGKLEAIDEDDIRKQEASPKNREQMVFSAAILSMNYDFIVCDAKAGSGKSFCAISSAMRLVRQKKFSTVYYLRNTVNNLERNEEVGFLPGGEAEKFAPFFSPLFDTLRVMIRKHLASKKMKAEDLELAIEEKLVEMMKSYNIKPITTLGLRGRTLTDSVVIMDECFVPDTEVLTESGWQRLDRLDKTLKVAQVDFNRNITFTHPSKYIDKEYSGDMINFTSNNGVEIMCTPKHDLLVEHKVHGIIKKKAKDINYDDNWSLPCAGYANGSDCTLTPLEKLAIALQADGSIGYTSTKGLPALQFSFSKPRKIMEFLRLIPELVELGFKITETKEGVHTGNKKTTRRFWINSPVTITKEVYNHISVVNISSTKAKAIITYAMIWDGYTKDNNLHYSSTNKNCSDFYQAVATLAGYKTKLVAVEDGRSDTYNTIYRLYINKGSKRIGGQSIGKSVTQYTGRVYCVTVPTGNIVIRRNGKVSLVGNCQNFSPSSAQTALTRIGENCMVIVLGSSRQIDNAYLNKYTSGLAVLIGALKKEHDNVKLFGIELTKVVRGRLTEFAEALFTKGTK